MTSSVDEKVAALEAYQDLIALAELCLRQANAARTPAGANELRRMAKEYEDRAAALMGGLPPTSLPEG